MATVLIEFIKNTEKRSEGDRVRVDPRSAVSFCDKLKVAKRVDGSEAEAEKPKARRKPGGKPKPDADPVAESDADASDESGEPVAEPEPAAQPE